MIARITSYTLSGRKILRLTIVIDKKVSEPKSCKEFGSSGRVAFMIPYNVK